MSNLTCPRCGSTEVSAHFTPFLPEGEADVWAPVREEGYRCKECTLIESCLNQDDGYVVFRNRWNDPIKKKTPEEYQAWLKHMDRREEEAAREWTWPSEDDHWGIGDRLSRAVQVEDHRQNSTYTWIRIGEDGKLAFDRVRELPRNDELINAVRANPDDLRARQRLAQWLRTEHHQMAAHAADFIEGQLRLACSLAEDPRSDVKASLPVEPFARRERQANDAVDTEWWRYPEIELGAAMWDDSKILENLGLIDDALYYRGFIEHVAIKATRFLEIADELYAAAPIRHLTITYAKGRNHDEPQLFEALLESPHLDRIRALKLPVRKFGRDKGDYTELNRLTDEDIERLAASEHLRGLRYLDLSDQQHLTIRAFHALAASKNLPELSAVRFDLHAYFYPGTFSFGRIGKQERQLSDRPLARFAAELEAAHGYIPWLHAKEHYGSESPDLEAVVEHPVALLERG